MRVLFCRAGVLLGLEDTMKTAHIVKASQVVHSGEGWWAQGDEEKGLSLSEECSLQGSPSFRQPAVAMS